MPTLSLYFIRASLVCFMAGVTIGALLLADKGMPGVSPVWPYRSAHIELSVLGWVVQLVMGTAYWILPRHPEGSPRGNRHVAWLSFYLLNAGIVFGVAALWFPVYPSADAFFRFFQLAGIACFAYVIWPRVLTFRKES